VPGATVPALEAWVKQGGVLVATGGVGRQGAYREANPEMQKFVGVETRKFEERDTFMRITMELPFLKPHSTVVLGSGAEMPVVGNFERITPVAGAKVIGTFKEDKSPAMIVREVGKGKVYYIAAQPGVSSLWSGLHPILVPDRGANTHTVRTNWDKAAGEFVSDMLKAGAVDPIVTTTPGLIDTRLIRGKSAYLLPLANYNTAVGSDIEVSVRVASGVKKVVASFAGELPFKMVKDRLVFTVPKMGYGEMVRIDVK